jgi:hypothetical protein
MKKNRQLLNPGKQSGATLLVGLIMLVLLTLVLVTSFNISKTNLVIVGNMQHKNEVAAAAQEALEEAISTTRLTESPDGIFLTPCAGPNTMCFDSNGDGINDITVALKSTYTDTPTCVYAKVIKNNDSDLDISREEDLRCVVGTQQAYGVEGAVTGDSRCSYTVWDVVAEATDNSTGARTEIAQGVGVRVLTDKVEAECPLV